MQLDSSVVADGGSNERLRQRPTSPGWIEHHSPGILNAAPRGTFGQGPGGAAASQQCERPSKRRPSLRLPPPCLIAPPSKPGWRASGVSLRQQGEKRQV